MACCEQMIQTLMQGGYDEALARLYAEDLDRARARAVQVVEEFQRQFAPADKTQVALFSGPGRAELGGNHTAPPPGSGGGAVCGPV